MKCRAWRPINVESATKEETLPVGHNREFWALCQNTAAPHSHWCVSCQEALARHPLGQIRKLAAESGELSNELLKELAEMDSKISISLTAKAELSKRGIEVDV